MRIVLALLFTLVWSFPAIAQDAAINSANAEIDKLEKQLEAVQPGDVPAANKIIQALNTVKQNLSRSRDRGKPEWNEAVRRANDLDKRTRERAAGQGGGTAPTGPTSATGTAAPPPAGPTDEHITSARADLDQIEKDLAAMAAGDRSEGVRIQANLEAAKQKLKKSKNQRSPAWAEVAIRANALGDRISAKANAAPAGDIPADQVTKDVQAELVEVEKAVIAMKAGDREEANRIVLKLNALRTKLGGSGARGAAWNAAIAKLDELDLRTRKRGGDVPATAADAKPLSAIDAGRLAEATRKYEKAIGELQAADIVYVVEREQTLRSEAVRFTSPLRTIRDQDHPDVRTAYAREAEYLKLLEEKLAAGKAKLAGAAADKDARHKEGDAIVAELSNAGELFAPIPQPDVNMKVESVTPDEVRGWAKAYKSILAAREKWLPKAKRANELLADKRPAPTIAFGGTGKSSDVPWFLRWIEQTLPGEVNQQIDRGLKTFNDRVEAAELNVRPAEKWTNDQLLSYESMIKSAETYVAIAIKALELRLAFESELGRDVSAIPAKSAQLQTLLTGILKAEADAVAKVRLQPEKVNNPELRKNAEAALKRGKYWDNVVKFIVQSDIRHHEEAQRYSNRALMCEWDSFTVYTAEKGADGNYWVVFYTLKYNYRGWDDWTLKTWLCSGRVVSSKILKENIDK